MRFGRQRQVAAALAIVLLAFGLGRASAGNKSDTTIVGVFGVGGVIASDGKLYQYLPDEKRWMTIDEAFKSTRNKTPRETHILPLPVPVESIREMESWGFLITKEGQVWQYDLESNRWRDIGTP